MQRIYNTLTRKKEKLEPFKADKVRIYVCGMTVYNYCHLGHAKMLVNFDIVQRWLRIGGQKVEYVRNITDIDDKIIKRSMELGKSLNEVTDFYIDAMHADEQALGIQSPTEEPRATSYIKEMLEIISELEYKGFTYRAKNGDINFSIKKFANYGKLSGKILRELRIGNRIKNGLVKRDPRDFVLWKLVEDNELPDRKWKSPYGFGRPGWHTECLAMSKTILGLPIDIHGGGPDLKFPHHENEIAQAESAFIGNFSNIWMHCGPLIINDEKMSNSLNNYYTIRQIIGYDNLSNSYYKSNKRESEMLRFFIAKNHYRSIQNYMFDGLVDSQNALDRLYRTLQNIPPANNYTFSWDEPRAKIFKESMEDDFNTAKAISVLFELSLQANRSTCSSTTKILKTLGGFLGFLQQDPKIYFQTTTRYSSSKMYQYNSSSQYISKLEIETLILSREKAKKMHEYIKADHIRDILRHAGIALEDQIDGQTQWYYM